MEQPWFSSIQDYGKRFTDVAYWQPYVETVCVRHRLTRCQHIQAGLPGTFPVFLLDDRYVVKFFGDLFHGCQSFKTELDCYALLGTPPQLPTPTLLGHGYLFPGSVAWRWPYLISTVITGTSLGAVKERVSYEDKAELVETLGALVHHLHAIPVKDTGFLAPTWERFLHFLHERRVACMDDHRRWGAMPERLMNQIEGYLPPIETLVDELVCPQLLHCDLNEDHVLGDFTGNHWRSTGIIDFGDAMVGDPIYELVALHIGLAHCDKRLLRIFLDCYGFDQKMREGFVLRAMSYTLLHEFAVLHQVFTEFPAVRNIESLAELAVLLWDPEHPGLH